MRVSHRYKFIFFANPKTGSSTIRKLLDPFSDARVADEFRGRSLHYPHMRPADVKWCFDDLQWDFSSYSRFVCVRNPWAKLVSLYHYIGRKQELPPFEAWLDQLVGDEEGPQKWKVLGSEPLQSYIHDLEGRMLVDRVFRTEDIDRELVPYLRSIGLPIPADAIPRRYNTTGLGSGYQNYYSPNSADQVRDLYQYEITEFGYKFGDPA